ncbi:hypothetical protein J3E72DRAFT_323511, partial [Bipolaris maydis]|uniref:uncharacterized protein n=1 Tax=Cochliobolus heterostrophus TaxID=5016 RepID=UPI0024DC16D8
MDSGRCYRAGYRFSFVLIFVLFDVWYAHGHFDRGTDCVMSLLHLLSVGFTGYHPRQGLEHVGTTVELCFFGHEEPLYSLDRYTFWIHVTIPPFIWNE